MAKKLLIGAGAIVVVAAVAGVFGGQSYYQGKMNADVQSVLSFISPSGKATFSALSYSIFSNEVTLSGVTLAGNSEKAPSVTIDRIVVRNPNRDNVRTIFNAASYVGETRNTAFLPLADAVTLEGIKSQQIGPYTATLASLTIEQPRARQFKQTPSVTALDMLARDPDTLLNIAESLQFNTTVLTALDARKERAATPEEAASDPLSVAANESIALRMDELAFGGLQDSVLTALSIKGVSVGIQKNAFSSAEPSKTEELTSKLASLVLENIDLGSLRAFATAIQIDGVKGMAAFKDIKVGTVAFDGYSLALKHSRVSYAWDEETLYDDDEADGDEDTSETESEERSYMEMVDMKVGHFSVRGLEKGKLGSLRIADVDFKVEASDKKYAKDNVKYHQGLVLVENYDIYAAMAPTIASLGYGYFGMLDNMGAMFEQIISPVQPEKMEIRDIRLEQAEVGVLALEEVVGGTTSKDDILVSSEAQFKGATWTLPKDVDRYDGLSEIRAMGYEQLSFSGKTKETFVPETHLYHLTFDMEGKDMGTLALNVNLGNYPRMKRGEASTEKGRREVMQRLETTLKAIEFHSAELRVEDRSLFDRIIAAYAKNEGMTVDEARESMRMDMMMDLEPGYQTLQKAAEAIARFIDEPATLTFSLKPEKPVKFGAFENLDDDSPEAVFSLLNLVVTYTERDVKP